MATPPPPMVALSHLAARVNPSMSNLCDLLVWFHSGR